MHNIYLRCIYELLYCSKNITKWCVQPSLCPHSCMNWPTALYIFGHWCMRPRYPNAIMLNKKKTRLVPWWPSWISYHHHPHPNIHLSVKFQVNWSNGCGTIMPPRKKQNVVVAEILGFLITAKIMEIICMIRSNCPENLKSIS